MDQAIIDLVNRFPADGEEGNLRSLLTPQHAKPLRSAAVKLKLNPQSRKSSSDNKQGYIELLVKYHRDKADGKLGQHAGPTKKKQQVQTEWRVSEHDIFLLANIVFSDAFVDRMPEADKNQTRAAPDNDAINESNPYWKDVTKAYNEEREKYKGLVAIRLQYQDVHPEKAVAHSTLKLIDMWKTLINRYAVTYKKSTSAGHTDGDFISHSNGRIDILYLHDWLQIHPNQLSKVCGSVIRQPPVSTLRQTPTSGPRQTPTSGPRQPPISTLRQPQTSIFERAIESDSSARMERSTCSKRRRDNPERQSSTEHLVNLVKNQRDEEKAMRGYEAVTRSSIAAQNALKTLQMMKDAGANEELVMQAQQKVDVVVKRWMDEMDSM